MPGRLSQSLWDWRLREARAPCADVSSHGAPPMDSTGGAYLRAHTAEGTDAAAAARSWHQDVARSAMTAYAAEEALLCTVVKHDNTTL